jgi:hypothetical protein
MIGAFHIILSRGAAGVYAARRRGRLQRDMTNLQALSRSLGFDAFDTFLPRRGDEIVAWRAARGSDLALLIRRSRYRRADSTRPSQRSAVHRDPRTQGVGSAPHRRSHPRPVPAFQPFRGREYIASMNAVLSASSIVRTRPKAAETYANYFIVWVSGVTSPTVGVAVGVGVLK